MNNQEFAVSAEDLLGPLNEVEQKYAPPRLYTSGDRALLEKGARVSIVGTRNPSEEGKKRARKLAGILAKRGAVVVSGLAKGIDTAAHTGAIEAGGRTLAVIGTPLDRCYPLENRELQHQIMQEHLCISQFPIGYPTKPANFPIRNRTMALFSDAGVIIEAGVKSGTISQGWEALRLGRGLFLSKALVDNPEISWTKEFLAFGARVLSNESVDEFLDELPERDPGILEYALGF